MDRVEMRDPAKRYHILTIAELQKLTPEYDWKLYLTGIGKGDVPPSMSPRRASTTASTPSSPRRSWTR
jgi:predicted metalloendopeptidase